MPLSAEEKQEKNRSEEVNEVKGINTASAVAVGCQRRLLQHQAAKDRPVSDRETEQQVVYLNHNC
jgi:hypothetical protein